MNNKETMAGFDEKCDKVSRKLTRFFNKFGKTQNVWQVVLYLQ